jgi:hypothetical protein
MRELLHLIHHVCVLYIWRVFSRSSSPLHHNQPHGRATPQQQMVICTNPRHAQLDKQMDLAASAKISLTLSMIKAEAAAQVKIQKQNGRKTVESVSKFDVQLYHLVAANYRNDDLHPELVAEFNALPTSWTDNPMAFDGFVRRWGTHYIKTAKVGGSFQMSGKVTTSNSVDNFGVAVQAKLVFNAGIKITAKAEVDYSTIDQNNRYDSSFNYNAVGGDPEVGAMLATAQKVSILSAASDTSGLKQAATAMTRWLQSLKKMPTLFDITLEPIENLLRTIGVDSRTNQRIIALQLAISIYLNEASPSGQLVTLNPNEGAKFSNFWRINNQCLSFDAAVGPQNKLEVSLTASASRQNIGYKLLLDTSGATLLRNGVQVKRSQAIATITPGSNILFSNYILCFEFNKGRLLYGRRGQIVLGFQDPQPLTSFFFGFGTSGPHQSTISSLSVYPFDALQCPGIGKPCGGPAQGTCNALKMCECTPGWMGTMCHIPCPRAANKQVCGGFGTCMLDNAQSEFAKPYCMCQSGRLGQACELDELPTLSFKSAPLSPHQKAYSGQPTRLNARAESKKIALDDLAPYIASITITVDDPALPDPVTTNGASAVHVFSPGEAVITARMKFVRNPDTVTLSVPISVLDCTCSGHGRCDAKGQCVCDEGSFGPVCENGVVSGLLSFEVAANSVKSGSLSRAYLPFNPPLLATPVSVNVTHFDTNTDVDLKISGTH